MHICSWKMLLIFLTLGLCVCNVTGVNIALNKPTRQTTDYLLTQQESFLANDGDRSQCVNPPPGVKGVCAQTINNPNEWWMVNLNAIFNIFNIEIYGRGDVYYTRFMDFDVDVIRPINIRCPLTMDTFEEGIVTFSFYVAVAVTYINISCPKDTYGQFIRIRNRGAQYLAVCEVEISGVLPSIRVGKSFHKGFSGYSYIGNTISSQYANSPVHCIAVCKQARCCFSASFNIDSKACKLQEKGSATTSNLIQNSEWNTYIYY